MFLSILILIGFFILAISPAQKILVARSEKIAATIYIIPMLYTGIKFALAHYIAFFHRPFVGRKFSICLDSRLIASHNKKA